MFSLLVHLMNPFSPALLVFLLHRRHARLGTRAFLGEGWGWVRKKSRQLLAWAMAIGVAWTRTLQVGMAVFAGLLVLFFLALPLSGQLLSPWLVGKVAAAGLGIAAVWGNVRVWQRYLGWNPTLGKPCPLMFYREYVVSGEKWKVALWLGGGLFLLSGSLMVLARWVWGLGSGEDGVMAGLAADDPGAVEVFLARYLGNTLPPAPSSSSARPKRL